MTTKTRRPAPAPAPAARSKTWLVWVAGLAVVVVAAIVAVVVTGGDDDTATDRPATTETVGTTDGSSAEPLPKFESTAGDPAIGMPLPALSGRSLDGESLRIDPADGKAKLVVFVAHWCPHCQAEVPRIVERLRSTPMPDDVELLSVSTAASPDAPNYPPKAWLEREGWTAPVLDDVDGSMAQAYGLSAYPFFVVADASGKVVARGSGEITMDQFGELVKAAQTGKLPT